MAVDTFRPRTKEQAVFDDFILDLSNLEERARRLGYPQTAHALQGAKNTAGWERVGYLERKIAAADKPKQKGIGKMAAKQKGGKARAEKLTPERRSEIARNAAKARWAKVAAKKNKKKFEKGTP